MIVSYNHMLCKLTSFLFSCSRAISARNPCRRVSQPSTPSGLAMIKCGTQHASCAAPAVSCLWTWSTSGRRARCTAGVTMATVRSLDVEDVMRWLDGLFIFNSLRVMCLRNDCFIFILVSIQHFGVSVLSSSSVMSILKLKARTGIWSTSAVSTATASWLERRMLWRMTSPSANPATWKTTLWWVSLHK